MVITPPVEVLKGARMLGRTGGAVNRDAEGNGLLQLRILRLGLPVDRNVGIGVFPEGEECMSKRPRCVIYSSNGARSQGEVQRDLFRHLDYGFGWATKNDQRVVSFCGPQECATPTSQMN